MTTPHLVSLGASLFQFPEPHISSYFHIFLHIFLILSHEVPSMGGWGEECNRGFPIVTHGSNISPEMTSMSGGGKGVYLRIFNSDPELKNFSQNYIKGRGEGNVLADFQQ